MGEELKKKIADFLAGVMLLAGGACLLAMLGCLGLGAFSWLRYGTWATVSVETVTQQLGVSSWPTFGTTGWLGVDHALSAMNRWIGAYQTSDLVWSLLALASIAIFAMERLESYSTKIFVAKHWPVAQGQ